MNAALANEPVVRFGLRRGWATSSTTVGNDIVDASITSDVGPHREDDFLIPILHYYAGALRAMPANRGKTFFVEAPSDEAGFITDAIASSMPGLLAASALGSVLGHRYYRALLPSGFFPEEVLNWGASIEKAPERPSGTLTVTLKYAGRGIPTPVEDPWD